MLFVMIRYSLISQENKNIFVDFVYKLIQQFLNDNFEVKIEECINAIKENLDLISKLPPNQLQSTETQKRLYTEKVTAAKDKLAVYFGLLQLNNRLIYENAVKNIIVQEVNCTMSAKLIYLFKYFTQENVENSNYINVIQNNIYYNSVYNMKVLSKSSNNLLYGELCKIYETKNKSEPLSDKTVDHWLFYLIVWDILYQFYGDMSKLKIF